MRMFWTLQIGIAVAAVGGFTALGVACSSTASSTDTDTDVGTDTDTETDTDTDTGEGTIRSHPLQPQLTSTTVP
jgi:hypothetical protein